MLQEQYTNGTKNTEFSLYEATSSFDTYFSDRLLTVSQNGNIFIDDIPGLSNIDTGYRQLAGDNSREIIVFNAEDLTKELAARLDQIPKSAGFIFPGNGSRIIQDIMQQTYPGTLQDRPLVAVGTKRTRENGIWSVSVDLPDLDEQMNQCTDWVIVDDVVLSGQTAEAIRQGFIEQTGRETDSWMLATWLSLDPKRRKKMTKTKSASSVEGFDAVSAVVTYKGGNGIPPCNSLSTLLQTDEKGDAVRDKLASSYFNTGFDQFLQQLAYGTMD